ncbi:MAG: hypothetical protein D6788_08765 [Planctomycetota bacterium]|nr:MAG: hypothetical protein D6788_08765 [Planctomycetota bacterium]
MIRCGGGWKRPVRRAAAGCLISVVQAAALPPVAFVQAPRGAEPVGGDLSRTLLASRYVEGMRLVVADLDDIPGSKQIVSEGFTAAADPVYRFDGQVLSFAGLRKGGTHWSIWQRFGSDGEPRRVVSLDADVGHPAYLPAGHIVFVSTVAGEYDEHGKTYSLSVYAARPEDDTPTRLTFNPSSDFDPAVLPDGRVLYSSWQHVGNHHWPAGVVALMLINSDGTGVFPFTGNHRGPFLKRGAQAIDDEHIVFITAERSAPFGAGSLVMASLNDPFAPYRVLISATDFLVSDAAPLPDGRLVVSAKPAGKESGTFGLYLYDRGRMTLLYDDPETDGLSPAVGVERKTPELRISTVVPGTSYGYLAILNVYETDRTDQHPLRPGTVRAVRFLEGRPVSHHDGEVTFLPSPGGQDEPWIQPASATGTLPARILGEVPPAPDGSVYVKVPADRPLRIQLIDNEGFAAVNERAWFWVRPNERRVCIGCHENRELAPPNTVPLAVRRAPTDLTDAAQWRTVTFRRDIQPIVRHTCAVSDCHVSPFPTAGMNLIVDRIDGTRNAPLADRFGPAYANLLARRKGKPFSVGGRRVHPGDARSSPLLWMLYGRALAKQYAPAPFERPLLKPHPGPMLPEAKLERFRTWVDLGAVYDAEAPPGDWPYTIPDLRTVVIEGKPDNGTKN